MGTSTRDPGPAVSAAAAGGRETPGTASASLGKEEGGTPSPHPIPAAPAGSRGAPELHPWQPCGGLRGARGPHVPGCHTQAGGFPARHGGAVCHPPTLCCLSPLAPGGEGPTRLRAQRPRAAAAARPPPPPCPAPGAAPPPPPPCGGPHGLLPAPPHPVAVLTAALCAQDHGGGDTWGRPWCRSSEQLPGARAPARPAPPGLSQGRAAPMSSGPRRASPQHRRHRHRPAPAMAGPGPRTAPPPLGLLLPTGTRSQPGPSFLGGRQDVCALARLELAVVTLGTPRSGTSTGPGAGPAALGVVSVPPGCHRRLSVTPSSGQIPAQTALLPAGRCRGRGWGPTELCPQQQSPRHVAVPLSAAWRGRVSLSHLDSAKSCSTA